MDLNLYKQAATPERVDKSGFLTSVGTVSGVQIKQPMDLMSPTFILKTDQLVYNANYLYCSFTSRYYYITSIEALTGGRIAVNCRIDVLYTYKDEILNSSGWILSSSSASDAAAYDMLHNDYPFRQDYDILGINFNDPNPPFNYDAWGEDNGLIYLVVK